jgi:hypothetical protein
MRFGRMAVVVLAVAAVAALAAMKSDTPPVMVAKFTETPVVIDGRLDDAVWDTATSYPLSLGRDSEARGETLHEPGEVRLAWDNEFLYVGVKYYDSDIVAEGKNDQEHHYQTGDLAEVFLKPERAPGIGNCTSRPTKRRRTCGSRAAGAWGSKATKNLRWNCTWQHSARVR